MLAVPSIRNAMSRPSSGSLREAKSDAVAAAVSAGGSGGAGHPRGSPALLRGWNRVFGLVDSFEERGIGWP
jgi:hypothetical protein